MCIIAAKPAGKAMPAASTIEQMWCRNHDGAGFMYAYGGKVHIEKGFMKLGDLTNALKRVRSTVDLDSCAVVMHFRIATHGGVIPANTHPFPVTSSIGLLQKLTCSTSLGVAHNGIISSVTPRKGISDTMEYIASQLGPLYKGVPNFYENPHLMEMVSNAVDSRLAFLTGEGKLYTVGNFVEDEGIMYSNSSYKPYDFTLSCYSTKWDSIADGHFNEYDEWEPDFRYKDTRLLRWLWCEENTYAIDGHGVQLDEFGDYAVDREGHLYEYLNWEWGDGFVLIPGGRAYDGKFQTIVASPDDEYSSMEDVYEEAEPPFEPDPPAPKTKQKKPKKFGKK